MFASILFVVLAIVAVAAGLGMLIARNPVNSALWLVLNLFCIAGLYLTLNAQFIAVVQVLVYAGAIMVLFLFVIMLLNLGHDYEPDIRGKVWRVVAAGSGLVMLALLARILGANDAPLGDMAGPDLLAAQIAEHGAVGAIGIPLFLDFVVPLQVTGILLLVAVVGAVVLAKRNV